MPIQMMVQYAGVNGRSPHVWFFLAPTTEIATFRGDLVIQDVQHDQEQIALDLPSITSGSLLSS